VRNVTQPRCVDFVKVLTNAMFMNPNLNSLMNELRSYFSKNNFGMAKELQVEKEINVQDANSQKKLLHAGRLLHDNGNHHHPFNEKLEWVETLIHTEELERRRFAEYLNDELGSMLAGIKNKLSGIDSEKNIEKKESKQSLTESIQLLDDAIEQVRNLAHHEMPVNIDFGLQNALNNLVARINNSNLLQVECHILNAEISLPLALETTVYRILQELLKNSIYHSKANIATISVYQHGLQLVIDVTDDGIGFNYQKELHHPKGLGLKKVFQRIQMLGGKLEVLSTQKVGSRFHIEIPLA